MRGCFLRQVDAMRSILPLCQGNRLQHLCNKFRLDKRVVMCVVRYCDLAMPNGANRDASPRLTAARAREGIRFVRAKIRPLSRRSLTVGANGGRCSMASQRSRGRRGARGGGAGSGCRCAAGRRRRRFSATRFPCATGHHRIGTVRRKSRRELVRIVADRFVHAFRLDSVERGDVGVDDDGTAADVDDPAPHLFEERRDRSGKTGGGRVHGHWFGCMVHFGILRLRLRAGSWNPRSDLVRHDSSSTGGGKPASTNARCG